jgi:hypothetical protein
MTDLSFCLPQRIVLPPDSIFAAGKHAGYWRYVRSTAAWLGEQTVLDYSDRLRRPAWSAFEIDVDGHRMVIDYSDFLLVDQKASAYKHWLRFHHTPAFSPFVHLGSFPPWSFTDWELYQRLSLKQRYSASGSSIIYRHSVWQGRLSNLIERRERALRILSEHCSNRLVTGFVSQDRYFQDCLGSLAVVHIPGSHPHILDRSVQQMFALGVCVISPDLWTTCLEQRPQAGVHYVSVQDDYSDLIAKVDWVAANREAAVAIGDAAKRFFASHCTPSAIWNYIMRRIHCGDQQASQGEISITGQDRWPRR